MRRKTPIRILALDLHFRSFGYVVVEGQSRLLHWGVCNYRQKGIAFNVLVTKRLRPLLELWEPAVLILKISSKMRLKTNYRRNSLLERIKAEATSHRIPMRVVKKNTGQNQGERLTKYESARRVAEHFPVLTRELPPKRRVWESEHYRVSIFNAATLAMSRQRDTPATPKPSFT